MVSSISTATPSSLAAATEVSETADDDVWNDDFDFEDDGEEVRMGTECGIAVKNYNDVKPGDQIEVFERIEVARSID